MVTNNGIVTWMLPATYTVICPHEFKTNTWNCVFRFGSWVYPMHQVDLHPFTAVVDLDDEDFPPNDHWGVFDHRGERVVADSEDNPFVSLVYIAKFRNKIGPSLTGRRK